ncbi:hypothetical protein [Prochlorococcus marinus]|uniref:Protein family PM-12 n=1 Tax=Prochlorococcus marinus str. PAC1 TaxID=59924 RepID=A0A0A2C3V0_PROMR|nr:hypothetical protein [Prochlorococcus marinus]KGG21016.1 protein family PM-12 [Prochlorococcus marinus str. PAC1]
MKRTQLNVSIDPKLLEKIKESARISGKSLVGYVSDCFVNQIENLPVESIDSRFQTIEQRLQSIENNLQLPALKAQRIQPFTSQEVENFNEFIKAVFRKELKRKGYRSMKEAWNDFINHINCFEQWDETCSFRLKESLFIEHADPLTSEEINHLREGDVCPQPIRTGIINWINNSDRGECCCSDKEFPSQQQICEKGSMLVEDIYS